MDSGSAVRAAACGGAGDGEPHTQLTTTLPREHTISVVCGAGGAVRVEGMDYTDTHAFVVDRLSRPCRMRDTA